MDLKKKITNITFFPGVNLKAGEAQTGRFAGLSYARF